MPEARSRERFRMEPAAKSAVPPVVGSARLQGFRRDRPGGGVVFAESTPNVLCINPVPEEFAMTARFAASLLVLAGLHAMPLAPAQDLLPDYSKLQLKGNGMSEDSVALALQAAARLLGREADYESVTCALGNPFSPALMLGETCSAHWQVEGALSTQGLPLAARHLGLKIERLPLPEFTGDTGKDEDLVMYRRACAPILNQALADGAVLLNEGGWDVRSGKRFIHWGMAGIITGAEAKAGTITGAHLWGVRDHPRKWPAAVWQVTRGDAPQPLARLGADVLRQAVARNRGKGGYARSKEMAYGLAAVDAWADRMVQTVGFCEPCYKPGKQSSLGDAEDNSRRVLKSSRVVAAYLDQLSKDAAPAARADLGAARDCYRRIIELLQPVMRGPKDGRYGAILGDLAKQRAHADAAIRPIRKQLTIAAEAMARAAAVLQP